MLAEQCSASLIPHEKLLSRPPSLKARSTWRFVSRPRYQTTPRLLFAPTAAAASQSGRCLPGELFPGELLGGKYEVQGVLGYGGAAITYKCRDVASGAQVAVKALLFGPTGNLRSWKHLELLEREAAVLRSLSHPAIPRYLDYFETDRGFCLVQEMVDGLSLADMVATGWRAEEAEVERIAGQALGILQYLGDLRPAVIHRDVKPDNLMIEGGRAGGWVQLVDFGGVQGAASLGRLGSTAIGTAGFMPPEQFSAACQPATDLYGLGATLLFLLSGRLPSEFPQARLRLDFSGVAMSPRLRLLLSGLLEPVVEERLSACQAQRLLQGDPEALAAAQAKWGAVGAGGQAPAGVAGQGLRQPPWSRVEVLQQGARLEVTLCARDDLGSIRATCWRSSLACLVTSMAVCPRVLGQVGAGLGLLAWLGISVYRSFATHQERLLITREVWQLKRVHIYADQPWEEVLMHGASRDLVGATAERVESGGGRASMVVLREGSRARAFGAGLCPEEHEWLADKLNRHISWVKQLSEG